MIRGIAFTGGYESLATLRHAAFFAAADAVPFQSKRFYGVSAFPAELRAPIFDRSATALYLLA